MPRAGLTRERVAEEAAVLADEVGLDELTLASLAKRLGVRQPSLYKHLDSLADLHRSISMRAKLDLGDELRRAAVGRAGADAIAAMSHAYRGWAKRHPARYAAANATPALGDDENAALSLDVVQVVADVLSAFRLEGDDAIDAVRAFRSMLHGFVTLEAGGAFALNADIDRSFDRLVRGFVIALAQWTGDDAG